MADNFEHSHNAGLLALLANGAQTNADFDFGKINKSYWEGLDQSFKNDFRDKLAAGLPKDPSTGLVDWGKSAALFGEGGQLDPAIAAGKLGQEQQIRKDAAADAYRHATGREPPPQPGSQPQQPPFVNSPSLNRSAMKLQAQPLNKGGVAPRGQLDPSGLGAEQDTQVTPLKFLLSQDVQPGYATEVALRRFKEWGINPNQVFDPNDPVIRAKMGPVITAAQNIGKVQPPQPGDNPPQGQPQPQMAPQPRQGAQPVPMVPTPVATQRIQPQGAQPAPQSQRSPFQNAVDQGLIPPGADPLRYYAGEKLRQASPDAGMREAATKTVDAINKSMELTASQRDLAASKRTPGLDEYIAQQEADKTSAKGVAESDVKEQDSIIAAGRAARPKLSTLNAMTNIIQTDKHLDLGPGSQTTLQIKMVLEKIGWPVGDLSGAQLLDKFNKIAAAESTKGVTSRGTNFDMKTFIAANPGLGLDEKGNIRMLGILAQNAQREVDLENLARKNRGNWDKWGDILTKYEDEHPIKDPTTGKVLSSHSIIAPTPSKAKGPATPVSGAAQAAPASPTISSKADYDKLPPGATFTGPDGKPWQKPK